MRNLSKNKEFVVMMIFVMLTSLSFITLKNKVQAYEIEQEILFADTEEEENADTEIKKPVDLLEELVESNALEVVKEEKEEVKKEEEKEIEVVKPVIKVTGSNLAVVHIPSAGILAQVRNGTDEETLKGYVGRFTQNAMPGEKGNFAICAHNNIYTELFRTLHTVRNNQEVYIYTKSHKYTYKVNSVEKIAPTQTEVLNENKDKKEITLITCTDMGRNRICVKGTLVKSEKL